MHQIILQIASIFLFFVVFTHSALAQFFNFNETQATQATQAQQLEAQMNIRISELEGQIRLLNGQIEGYENRIRRIEDTQKRFQEDVDFRFKDLETNKTMSNSTSANGAVGSISPPKKSIDAAQTQTSASEPSLILQKPSVEDTAAQTLAVMKANQSVIPPQTTQKPSMSTAKIDYDLAYGYFVRGDYEMAESNFKNFLKIYANDINAANAQFWLGETQFSRKKYKEAADSFLTAYQKYPNGAKATDNLLKLGMSLSRLNAKPEACGTFAEVAKKFPRASVSIKSQLNAERKLANCG